MTNKSILLKMGIRSDRIWTRPYVYKSFLKIIPLFLDLYALGKSQYWSSSETTAYQRTRLQTLFKEASYVPFWGEVFRQAHVDASMPAERVLGSIPVTAKKKLTAQQLRSIANLSLFAQSDKDHTSGSTGRPFHFYQDWHASLRSFAITERMFRAMTTGRRYPIVYMRSRERYGFTFYRHTWFYLRGYTSIQYRIDDFKKLKRFKKGFVLYGYTSWVIELAKQLEKLDIQLPVRAVVVAGEHVSDSEREYIGTVMKAEVFSLYASREVGFLAFECERHRLHINEEWAYVEIVDAENKPVPEDVEGRIVVTTFDNLVMPFIRYEIGDLGIIRDSPCECGRTLRTLSFRGRTLELVELEDNRKVSLLDIAYAFGTYRNAIRQYMIIQTSPTSFVFRVIPGDFFEDRKEFLEALMIRLLHPRIKISWEIVDSIPEAPSGKAQYFVRNFNYHET
jgi:phenylacetate-CoA ligase